MRLIYSIRDTINRPGSLLTEKMSKAIALDDASCCRRKLKAPYKMRQFTHEHQSSWLLAQYLLSQALGIHPVSFHHRRLASLLKSGRHWRCFRVRTTWLLRPYSLTNTELFRRIFAKAGYNIALIARKSDSLHKFAAELKTGDTDVHCTPLPTVLLILTSLFSFFFFRQLRSRYPNTTTKKCKPPSARCASTGRTPMSA